jgi:flavin reductase (DIM6/NTAB) family NADH-FMN oxidoreductase RutF
MTVSSFTSVSLDPPLILVCIDRAASFLKDLTPGLPIAINVLAEDQQVLSVLFANRNEEDRFTSVEWEPGLRGVPLISGALASFACSLYEVVEGGDHLVLIAKVEDIRRREGNPLVWCDRNYHCLPRQAGE